jgi:hypothetical protein
MKTTRNILTALIAAGTPGVAVLTLTNLVPADLALAGLTAVGLFAFAIYDFSRNTASLRVRAAVLRPPLHVADRPGSATFRKAA